MYYKTGSALNSIPENWELESKTSGGLQETHSFRKLSPSTNNDSRLQQSSQKAISVKDLPLNLDESRKNEKTEKVERIKARIKLLFLNYCDYNEEKGEVFVTYTNFIKIIKDALIYDSQVNQNLISIIISKECNVTTTMVNHISFENFLNVLLRIS